MGLNLKSKQQKISINAYNVHKALQVIKINTI